MNSNDDELTALALDYLRHSDSILENVKSAFANMPRAPLAKTIEAFLAVSPRIDVAPLLKKISETNQGRIEDLAAPEFRSYLIDRCSTNDVELQKAISALKNFHSYQSVANDLEREILIAARDDGNTGHKSTTMTELMKQVGKRVK